MSSTINTNSTKTPQQQDIQRLMQAIASNLTKISQNVSQLEGLVQQIGTPRDSDLLRERLIQTENNTHQLAKEVNRQLKELNNYTRNTDDRSLKLQKERSTNDLMRVLNKFQEIQRLNIQKQKESNERARANMSNINNMEHTPDLNIDANNQISVEKNVSIEQLREREEVLRKLENDVTDINVIFKDLAVMVHDQGTVVDTIESNIENSRGRIGQAVVHLQGAKELQSDTRKKKVILAVIMTIVILVVVLLIVLSFQNWN